MGFSPYLETRGSHVLTDALLKLLESERQGSCVKMSARPLRHLQVFTLVYVIALGGGGLAFSQEPIHVAVNLVNVAFSVRDSRGTLVDNLNKEDVEIFEDAAPQKISFFARSTHVPLTLGLIVDVSGSQEHFSKQHEN